MDSLSPITQSPNPDTSIQPQTPSGNRMKIIIIALLVVLGLGYAVYAYVLAPATQKQTSTNKSVSATPPSLTLPTNGLKGSFQDTDSMYGFMEHKEGDVWTAPQNQDPVELQSGPNQLQVPTDTTLEDIAKNINLPLSGKAFVAFYDPIQMNFVTYPKGPFPGTILGKLDTKVSAGTGMVIISRNKSQIYGLRDTTKPSAISISVDPTIEGWVLVIANDTSLSKVLTPLSGREEEVYIQKTPTTFEKVKKDDISSTTLKDYFLIWIKVKKADPKAEPVKQAADKPAANASDPLPAAPIVKASMDTISPKAIFSGMDFNLKVTGNNLDFTDKGAIKLTNGQEVPIGIAKKEGDTKTLTLSGKVPSETLNQNAEIILTDKGNKTIGSLPIKIINQTQYVNDMQQDWKKAFEMKLLTYLKKNNTSPTEGHMIVKGKNEKGDPDQSFSAILRLYFPGKTLGSWDSIILKDDKGATYENKKVSYDSSDGLAQAFPFVIPDEYVEKENKQLQLELTMEVTDKETETAVTGVIIKTLDLKNGTPWGNPVVSSVDKSILWKGYGEDYVIKGENFEYKNTQLELPKDVNMDWEIDYIAGKGSVWSELKLTLKDKGTPEGKYTLFITTKDSQGVLRKSNGFDIEVVDVNPEITQVSGNSIKVGQKGTVTIGGKRLLINKGNPPTAIEYLGENPPATTLKPSIDYNTSTENSLKIDIADYGTKPGTYAFDLYTVINNVPRKSKTFTITVEKPNPTITSLSKSGILVGSTYNFIKIKGMDLSGIDDARIKLQDGSILSTKFTKGSDTECEISGTIPDNLKEQKAVIELLTAGEAQVTSSIELREEEKEKEKFTKLWSETVEVKIENMVTKDNGTTGTIILKGTDKIQTVNQDINAIDMQSIYTPSGKAIPGILKIAYNNGNLTLKESAEGVTEVAGVIKIPFYAFTENKTSIDYKWNPKVFDMTTATSYGNGVSYNIVFTQSIPIK